MTRRLTLLAPVLLLAAAPGAGAQEQGATTISLQGRAAKQLEAQGVRISARKPARATLTRLTLPVTSGAVARTARLDHGGSVTLRRGRRSVRLMRVRSSLGRRSTVSALVAGRRRTLFTVARRPSLDTGTGTVKLASSRVTLTRTGARAIARALRLRRVRHGTFGTLRVDAVVRRASGGSGSGSAAGGGAGSGSGVSAGSGSGSGAGGTGSGTPSTTPIGNEPPVLARPASAVPITGATLNWHVRDSFIQYINSGEGTTPSRGASNGPKTTRPGSPVPLVYDFGFAVPSGWWDAGSQTAGVYHQGTVNFRYSLHGIDFDAKDPEIEINGSRSRAIFRFDGRGNTNPGDKRAVLVDLHLDRARSITHEGSQHTYTQVPGTIPEGTDASIFAGFYEPGEEFGWVDVAFTAG